MSESPKNQEIEGGNILYAPVSRREAFGLTAGFALAILGACRDKTPEKKALSSEEPSANQVLKTEEKQQPAAAVPSPEIPFDPSIPLPAFEFVDKPFPLEMPGTLKMSEKDFHELCKKIADQVRQGMELFLIPMLAENPGNHSPIFSQFIQRTAHMIETISPASQAAMIDFSTTWDNEPDSLVNEVNKYLIPAGLYLQLMWEHGQMSVSVLPVEKTASVKISDPQGQEEIPVIFAKPDLLGSGRSAGAEMGFSDSKFTHAVVFANKVKPTSDDVKRHLALSGFTSFPENFDEIMLRDFLTHESTHVFLARRFPKKGAIRTIGHNFAVPLKVKINDSKESMIDLDGNYPPAVFHELAGVGIEIARGDSPISYQAILHTVALDNPPTYFMVQKLLPLAILMLADDQNPKKKRLMDRLLDPDTSGNLILVEVAELLKDPEFQSGKARKIGEIFYKLAYGVLKNMEDGKYREIAAQQ